jgi:peptide-methionine (R)-S-oxide reductase
MHDRVYKTDDEWRQQLTPEQYRVLREASDEPPYSSEMWKQHGRGVYCCVGCGHPLFSWKAKFYPDTGWPSFWGPINEKHVSPHEDRSHFQPAGEVACSRCGAHLGRVFTDGPSPTGLRYSINSVALAFEPEEQFQEEQRLEEEGLGAPAAE